jgi:hypothetical protein
VVGILAPSGTCANGASSGATSAPIPTRHAGCTDGSVVGGG